jgi:hypothetical protein
MIMSLGRLLAAGKSLIGLSNGESRYRENKRVRLPKFISPKNPFATGEKPVEVRASAAAVTVAPVTVPSVVQPGVPVAVQAAVPVEAPAPVAAVLPVVVETPAPVVAVVETAPVPAPAPVKLETLAAAQKRAVAPKPVKPARTGSLFGGLGKKLNPFARGAAKPAAVVTPRQAELALERVQVVRNDLSDADVETAPVVTGGAKLSLPLVAGAREKLEPVGAAWNRLTTKFLGTDQP